MTQEQLQALETPCIVIDADIARKNIESMQNLVQSAGCALRPHIKTHKIPFFARLQIKAGAQGITCAKISEAEVMFGGGIDDIFVAYPMVGDFRIRRAISLSHQIKRLILAVDSIECASQLNAAAVADGCTLEVRIEIDTGAGRTGVCIKNAVELAKAVKKMPGLNLTGIYTFKSLVYQGLPTSNANLAAQEEGELMAYVAAAIRKAGIEIKDISAGSSPTGVQVAQTGLVTEVRPGTYIFKDQLLCSEGVCTKSEVAARYVTTVVSAQHSEYAVIDGGSKAFATDIPLNTAPFYYNSYAKVEGMENLCLSRMNEEHGILTAKNGKTGLAVGDVLTLVPIHICTAINMQNKVYILQNEKLTQITVEARGMTV